ncbi:cobalamin biosynthesis protein [Streptomyces sp. UNOC14_S4]|uniref:cobalamin biosynthesis protein n=1 Tax=Streptomyces sp. UNOC14_S4 TaxID=2872340 RepID=UPI001E3C099B|nr:cobalamin biosynthesis protein [Streptomyces sp. UNOC14_S4]
MCPASPAYLYVGVGARRGVAADEVLALVGEVLGGAVPVALATAGAKAREPGLLAAAARLGVPLLAYGPDELASVAVPNPSDAALAAVGAPGVAEAAALLAAGPDGVLVVAKRKTARVTCAVARGPG